MVAELAALMAHHGPALVLSGAGMSTASGLPDYRGPSGLWRNRRFEELASINMWRNHPDEFWEFYRMRLDQLRSARPNPGHDVLARLEQAGHVSCIITQNVDGLHARAGSTTLEVHGSLAHAICLTCGHRLPMDEALQRAGDELVPFCACGSVLKPDVVLFGEMLPPAFEESIAMVQRCSSLLVLGTSLQVEPVASIVRLAASCGARVAIVTMGTTSSDALADVRIDSDIASTLLDLASLLEV